MRLDPILLADYELTAEPLGDGGTALVHLARARSDCGRKGLQDLAVKVVGNPKAGLLPQEKALQTLQRELEFLKDLQGHGNIVALHGVCRVHAVAGGLLACCSADCGACAKLPDPPYVALALEYCPGGDLFDVVRNRTMTESRAVEVMRGILAGLAFVHSLQIVHRDVKAENVLLAVNDRAVLIDFGTASRLSDEHDMRKQCGSPGYCAPEVILGQDYGVKIDCFSAGVILYFAVSGKRPFSGKTTEEVLKRTVKGRVKFTEKFEDVSPACRTLIAELLERDPQARASAESALQHSWFAGPLAPEVLQSSMMSAEGSVCIWPPVSPPGSDPCCPASTGDLVEAAASTSQAGGSGIGTLAPRWYLNRASPSARGSHMSRMTHSTGGETFDDCFDRRSYRSHLSYTPSCVSTESFSCSSPYFGADADDAAGSQQANRLAARTLAGASTRRGPHGQTLTADLAMERSSEPGLGGSCANVRPGAAPVFHPPSRGAASGAAPLQQQLRPERPGRFGQAARQSAVQVRFSRDEVAEFEGDLPGAMATPPAASGAEPMGFDLLDAQRMTFVGEH